MVKKCFMLAVASLFFIFALEPIYARGTRGARAKNLYPLVEHKTLKVYLGSIESESEKVSSEEFREALRDFLQSRKKENFIVTDTKEEAKIIINAKLLDYKYLEDDPVDQLSGGLTGLLVDAAVSQNYARVDVEFTVLRTKDNRKLWHREFYSTVTESDMPEPESIPKVLKQSCKQFVFLCFGKSKR